MAQIQCECGNSFSVKDQFAGLPVGCPHCSIKHIVPKSNVVSAPPPEAPLEVQPIGAPIGRYAHGMGKPKGTNVGVGVAIVLGVTALAAVLLLVGGIFIARSFKNTVDQVQTEVAEAVADSPAFQPEALLDSPPPVLKPDRGDQQNQPVAQKDTVRLIPQDQMRRAPQQQGGRAMLGRQGNRVPGARVPGNRAQGGNNAQSRRRQIYVMAKARLSGPEQILQRQMQSQARVPERIRTLRQQSMQRIIASTKKSLCNQYNLTPFELESIIQEGKMSNW